MARVEGSGTATGLARRKPKRSSSPDGSFVPPKEDDKKTAMG